MILLLGGTAETAPLALALAEAGHGVLVSTATDVPLAIPTHPLVRRRAGVLDHARMRAVAAAEAVSFIVDATHPFATAVKRTARRVARGLALPYLALVRPPTDLGRHQDQPFRVSDHHRAAVMATIGGGPVLLTIGTRHLETYAGAASKRKVVLVARVLDHADSLAACRRAGLAEDLIVRGRGPFSVEQNRAVIRRFQIQVLVTKDSGGAGGVHAKLQAAAAEGCRVVMVDRPHSETGSSVASIAEVVDTVDAYLG